MNGVCLQCTATYKHINRKKLYSNSLNKLNALELRKSAKRINKLHSQKSWNKRQKNEEEKKKNIYTHIPSYRVSARVQKITVYENERKKVEREKFKGGCTDSAMWFDVMVINSRKMHKIHLQSIKTNAWILFAFPPSTIYMQLINIFHALHSSAMEAWATEFNRRQHCVNITTLLCNS